MWRRCSSSMPDLRVLSMNGWGSKRLAEVLDSPIAPAISPFITGAGLASQQAVFPCLEELHFQHPSWSPNGLASEHLAQCCDALDRRSTPEFQLSEVLSV